MEWAVVGVVVVIALLAVVITRRRALEAERASRARETGAASPPGPDDTNRERG